MRHIGVELTSFTLVDYFLFHFICSWPVKSRSVCFSHNGPRGRMVATGPRVDIIKDYPTFLWCYALLTDSGYAFPEQLSSYHSKGFGSTDDLSSLFLILRELFSQDIRDIWNCLVGNDHQDLHDQVDHCWDFNLSRICDTLGLWSFFGERIFFD